MNLRIPWIQFPVVSKNLPLVTSIHGRSLQHTAFYTKWTRDFHGHKVNNGADSHNNVWSCNTTPTYAFMARTGRNLFYVTWLSGFKRTSLTIDNKNSNRNTLTFAVTVRAVWNLIPLHSPPPDLPELYFHTINLESIFSIFVKDPLPVGEALWRDKDSQVECCSH